MLLIFINKIKSYGIITNNIKDKCGIILKLCIKLYNIISEEFCEKTSKTWIITTRNKWNTETNRRNLSDLEETISDQLGLAKADINSKSSEREWVDKMECKVI